MEQSGKNNALIMIIIILIVGVLAVKYNAYKKAEKEYELEQERIRAEEENKIIRDEKIIRSTLEEAIKEGKANNIYMSVSADFSEDDLDRIADSIDPMMGDVTQFTYTTSSTTTQDGKELYDGHIGVNFSFVTEDTWFVYEYIKEGKAIPVDRPKAAEMAKVCEDFMKNEIKSGMSDYEKELAIHDFIVNNCRYEDSGDNHGPDHDAYGVLVQHKGVCEGYAKAANLLLRCCDVETKLLSGIVENSAPKDESAELPEVSEDSEEDGSADVEEDGSADVEEDGSADGEENHEKTGLTVVTSDDNHMWNQVKIDDKWYHMDVTWDDPIGDEDELCHTYMNVSDKILSQNHSWDSSNAETCSSMDSNYYYMNDIYFENDSSFKEYVKERLEAGERESIECAVYRADLSQEAMYFMFDYEGINSYSISNYNLRGYKILTIVFNE